MYMNEDNLVGWVTMRNLQANPTHRVKTIESIKHNMTYMYALMFKLFHFGHITHSELMYANEGNPTRQL